MMSPPTLPRSVNSVFELLAARPGTINRILGVALQEWSFFGGGIDFRTGPDIYGKKETATHYDQRVAKYWKEGLGLNHNGDDGIAWSAAFISYCIHTAGVSDRDFNRAQAHSKYIHRAIKNRIQRVPDAKFVAWRLNEYKPKEGDLVCHWRETVQTYDTAAQNDSFFSHTDFVVYVQPDEIGVIGGNVSDSVTLKILAIDGAGYLKKSGTHLFAVMENRLPVK